MRLMATGTTVEVNLMEDACSGPPHEKGTQGIAGRLGRTQRLQPTAVTTSDSGVHLVGPMWFDL